MEQDGGAQPNPERCDSVDVVLAHLADVLEEEGERLEHAVL